MNLIADSELTAADSARVQRFEPSSSDGRPVRVERWIASARGGCSRGDLSMVVTHKSDMTFTRWQPIIPLNLVTCQHKCH